MRGVPPTSKANLRLLLASSSLAALLVGGGTPSAYATCGSAAVVTGAQPGYTNATGACITALHITNANVSGSVVNLGTITGALSVNTNSTVGGQIADYGTIGGGISIDSTSEVTVSGSQQAIVVNAPVFTGGITNAGLVATTRYSGILIFGVTSSFSGDVTNSGTISSAHTGNGIAVGGVSTFAAAITNSGTISAPGDVGISLSNNAVFGRNAAGGGIVNSGTIAGNFGILVEHGTGDIFQGGVTNSGSSLIAASQAGIAITDQATFLGGISNAGTITLAAGISHIGIQVNGVSAFGGGITNSGVIDPPTGIAVTNVSSYSGGIVNAAAGTITGTNYGVLVQTVSTFAGGISNAGTISATDKVGILVQGVSTFQSGIVNSGLVTGPTAISIVSSTINGGIADSGNIYGTSHGVLIDHASAVDLSPAISSRGE
jgi:hypothetical protein